VTEVEQDSSVLVHGNLPTCFRITGIPSHWDQNTLEEGLRGIDRDLHPENIELSIFRACTYTATTSTALLRLQRNIKYFEGWKQRDEKQFWLCEQGGKKNVLLKIDKHFYGLTPLNNPKAPINAEFVPLHIPNRTLKSLRFVALLP
jgi:hypothetical protein